MSVTAVSNGSSPAMAEALTINGSSLTIDQVVAVAHSRKVSVTISPDVKEGMDRSVMGLKAYLAGGNVVYGVNSGFGGSANTRTDDYAALQQSLLQMQTYGILTKHDTGKSSTTALASASMPSSWVRAAMLIRCNSLVRGHSAVRYEVVECLAMFLNNNITPVVPLRGSISASGDLSPLSYIAAAIAGNPDVYVRVGLGAEERVMPSSHALELVGRLPHILLAKEGLGLMNGTAVSAGVASLAIWESQRIAGLAQICTAMATESLQGHAANFHPFFGQVRPHAGQAISARNILEFLSGSELAKHTQDNTSHKLRTLPFTTSHLVQDRYALRTASQWIGPCLEDLSLAASQVSVELNSTTDNPIFATTRDYTDPNLLLFENHCGGNFQALSVTMAMEKTRSALQLLGKLVFAQSSEIINPALSNGLPTNLSFDDPSLSFTCKGIDIGMAAYMSELASLANPVSNCVQSAEMHNQSINSLALVSARKTLEAVEVIRIMLATYLYLLCQALDLCVLQLRFKRIAESEMHLLTWRWFADTGTDIHSLAMDMNANTDIGAAGQKTPVSGDHLDSKATLNELALDLWRVIEDSWDSTGTCDLEERVIKAIASTSFVFNLYDKNTQTQDRKQNQVELANYSASVQSWQYAVQSMLQKTYEDLRNEMLEAYLAITPTYLGRAGKIMYAFVRDDAPRGLGVEPCRGLVDMPGIGGVGRRPRKTIGSWISMIYESMLGGEGEKKGLFDVVEECMTAVGIDNNGSAKAPLNGGCGIPKAGAENS